MKKFLSLLFVAIIIALNLQLVAFADTISLVSDPLRAVDSESIGTATYFLSQTSGLYATDGAGGVELIKDISGEYGMEEISSPEMININDTLYFIAADGNLGKEVWKSDGTAEGTVILKDINPPMYGMETSSSSNPSHLVDLNGVLYFFASSGSMDIELWKSDGTEGGTVMINGPKIPPNWGTDFSEMVAAPDDGLVYFVANYSDMGTDYGNEVWRSDGTDLGTEMVKDINPGMFSSDPSDFQYTNGSLYFLVYDMNSMASYLWESTDGTESNTALVTPAGLSGTASDLKAIGNNLYFILTADMVSSLWKYDGASASSVGSTFTYDSMTGPKMTESNGSLFFVATSSGMEYDIFTTNGTDSTYAIKDLGDSAFKPTGLTDVDGVLYFIASDSGMPSDNVELWKTDGTEIGTVQVTDINETGASFSSELPHMVAVGGEGNVYFTTSTDGMSYQLYSAGDGISGDGGGDEAGGAEGSASLVKTLGMPGPQSFTEMGGVSYFFASDGINGTELWKSDGTTEGTEMVKDINTTSSGVDVMMGSADMVAIGSTLYFSANDDINGKELWKSDGTSVGTEMVKDIYSGWDNSSPSSFINVNGTLFFLADDGTNGMELWKSDGTEGGTEMVKDINTTGSGFDTMMGSIKMVAVGSTLYFPANDGVNGNELWKSDGTSIGTEMVKDIHTGGGDGGLLYTTNIMAVGSTIFFAAEDGINGKELWKSDGTSVGTEMVKNIRSIGDSYPNSFINVNGTLFFLAEDGINGKELWKSDGTEGGTEIVKDIYAGYSNGIEVMASDIDMAAIGSTLYFPANDGSEGIELWKSDGTSEGTVLADIITDGMDGTTFGEIFDFGDIILMNATEYTATDPGLWKYEPPVVVVEGGSEAVPEFSTYVYISMILLAFGIMYYRVPKMGIRTR